MLTFINGGMHIRPDSVLITRSICLVLQYFSTFSKQMYRMFLASSSQLALFIYSVRLQLNHSQVLMLWYNDKIEDKDYE